MVLYKKVRQQSAHKARQALGITGIHSGLQARLIEGVDEATFTEIAEGAKYNYLS